MLRAMMIAVLMWGGAAWGQTNQETQRLLALARDMAAARLYGMHCAVARRQDGAVSRIDAMLREQARQLATTDEMRGFLRGAQSAHEGSLLSMTAGQRIAETLCAGLTEPLLRIALEAVLLGPVPGIPPSGPALQQRRGD